MQQVGSIAALIAAKIFSLVPHVRFPQFNLTVRRKKRLQAAISFFPLFVFPMVAFYTGYSYVQDKGGVATVLSDFTHLRVKKEEISVLQNNSFVHNSEWNINPKDIENALPSTVGQSLFNLNLEAIRKTINQVPWVKSSIIKITLPSTLSIVVTEQIPVALWQKDGLLHLIDNDGKVITTENQDIERYDYLPLVIGENANLMIDEYSALMKYYVDIFKYIRSGTRVNNRLWTLTTQMGAKIKLSGTNPKESLEQLMILQNNSNILDKDYSHIDIQPDAVFVRQRGSATFLVYDTRHH